MKTHPRELPLPELAASVTNRESIAGTWRKKVALAFATFIIVCTGAVGTVFAAQKALPGDALYGIKLAADQLSVDISQSPAVRVDVANRRIEEIRQVLGTQPAANTSGRVQADIQSALHQYQSVLQGATAEINTDSVNSAAATSSPASVVRTILRKTENNEQDLKKILSTGTGNATITQDLENSLQSSRQTANAAHAALNDTATTTRTSGENVRTRSVGERHVEAAITSSSTSTIPGNFAGAVKAAGETGAARETHNEIHNNDEGNNNGGDSGNTNSDGEGGAKNNTSINTSSTADH